MTIRQLVAQFVSQVETEIRRAALEAVSASLGAPPTAPLPRRQPAAPKPAKGKPASSKATPAGRARRSPADLDRDVGRLVAFVRANNGQTNEKVRAALHLSKTEWTSTLAKAIATKQLATKGEKRSTTLHLLGK